MLNGGNCNTGGEEDSSLRKRQSQETADDLAEDSSLRIRGHGAELRALGTLASSYHQKLESLFVEHLKQQRYIFEAVASSNTGEPCTANDFESVNSLREAKLIVSKTVMTPPAWLPPELPFAPIHPEAELASASDNLDTSYTPAAVNRADTIEAADTVRTMKSDRSDVWASEDYLKLRHRSIMPKSSIERSWLRELCCNQPERDEQRQAPMQRIIDHIIFRYFISIVILINTVTLGLSSEDTVKAAMSEQPPKEIWATMELIFCAVFAVELLLKMVAQRTNFLFGPDRRWNLFDSFIVLHSLVDQLGHFAPNLTFARLVRVVRFLGIMRLVRVLRVFTGFRLMVYSLLGSMLNMLWIFLWLFLSLYSFAVFFLHGVAESYTLVDTSTQETMAEYYGSVFRCMLSLFMCVSGGDDWANRLDPFWYTSDIYLCVFILYIFFMVFGAVNVVVASFVETAAEVARRDQESLIERQIVKTQEFSEEVRSFFHAADMDGSGDLRRQELCEYLKDEKAKASFSSLGLDVSQAIDLFDLLDSNEDGFISLDEFLSGCLRLKGGASSMDVNLLLWEVEKISCKLSATSTQINQCFFWLEKLMGIPGETDAPSHRPSKRTLEGCPRKKKLAAWTAENKRPTQQHRRKNSGVVATLSGVLP